MKNLQTGTTCLSSSTGSKQHKCRRSLQRLATFVILFLCSMNCIVGARNDDGQDFQLYANKQE